MRGTFFIHQLEDMQVAVIRAGLPEQDKRRREEMRLIHNFGILTPGGLNQDFYLTWLAPVQARLFYARIFKFSNFPPYRTHIFSLMKAALPKRRSFICNSVLAFNLPPSHF